MVNTKFEAYKLQRILRQNGKQYTFTRKAENKYHEKQGEQFTVGIVTAVFHEQNSQVTSNYVSAMTSDGGIVRSRKMPCLLTSMEAVNGIGLCAGDEVQMSGKVYRVTAITDIQKFGIYADISLEVVDNGTIV